MAPLGVALGATAPGGETSALRAHFASATVSGARGWRAAVFVSSERSGGTTPGGGPRVDNYAFWAALVPRPARPVADPVGQRCRRPDRPQLPAGQRGDRPSCYLRYST